jgi:hypothetical protein
MKKKLTKNRRARAAVSSSRVVVPLCGPPDGWPRTSDGWLVKPGSVVDAHGATGMVVRKVYDGGEYGYCVELESGSGSEGWTALRACRHNVEADARRVEQPKEQHGN